MAAPLLSNVTLRTLCLENLGSLAGVAVRCLAKACHICKYEGANVVRDRCANASLKLVDVFPRFMVHALRVHDSSVQLAS